MPELIHKINIAIAVYSIFLIVFGTFFNLFSCFICLRKLLRKKPTFIFYALMLICDCFTLYCWNIDHYLFTFHKFQLEDLSLLSCKLVTFIQCFSLQYSAWLLVGMSIERYISITATKVKQTIKSVKCAIHCSIFLGVVLICINLMFVIKIEFDEELNEHKNVSNLIIINPSCFDAYFYEIAMKFHTYAYSFVPFVFMLIVNGLLIKKILLRNSQITNTDRRFKRRMTASISIIMLTLTFILTTLPNAIVNGWFIPGIFKTDTGVSILFGTDSLSLTFHSFNCVILYLTNKKFKYEFNSVLFCLQSKKASIKHVIVKPPLFKSTMRNRK